MRTLPFLFVLAIASCRQPNVIVVDSAGTAIEGASVESISLSINGSSSLTDKNGAVNISEGGVQATEWISVTKAGYIDSGHIKFNQPKPIRITLTK